MCLLVFKIFIKFLVFIPSLIKYFYIFLDQAQIDFDQTTSHNIINNSTTLNFDSKMPQLQKLPGKLIFIFYCFYFISFLINISTPKKQNQVGFL